LIRWVGPLGIVGLFLILRFVGLEADAPFGLTWSGALFTDEGWYSNAAVRDANGLPWYVYGDFNPAVSMPLGQVVMRGVFEVAEPGLLIARATVAAATAMAILVWFEIVRRSHGTEAAVITALILSVSSFYFGFSRLAFMEHLGLLFAALCLFLLTFARSDRWNVGISAAAAHLACAAVLVKANMVFVVPAGLVLILLQSGSLRRALAASTTFVAAFSFIVGGYQVIARHFFALDLAYFRAINLEFRSIGSVREWLANVLEKLAQLSSSLGAPLTSFIALVVLLGLMSDRKLWRAPLFVVSIVWITFSIGLASVINHAPLRYMIPLFPAVAILAGVSFARLRQGRYWQMPVVVALVYSIGLGALVFESARNLRYLTSLEHTFLDMVRDVAATARDDVGADREPILIGSFADTVALETGIKSVNSEFGLLPIHSRIAAGSRPTHLVLFTVNELAVSAIEAHGGELTPLKTWDVMQNYYHRIPTELSRISWPDPVETPPD
jgi:hypothetical protein